MCRLLSQRILKYQLDTPFHNSHFNVHNSVPQCKIFFWHMVALSAYKGFSKLQH